uniref:Replication initiation protein n=1 Tax=Polaromonas sp. H8N TaxID=1840297 RepID=A0A2S1FIB3_9BURK|nr:replication protein RepA [Polaromonas sp. H8N]AWD72262.1 replication initiation protein [Polaromonas sp. H8N]
MAKNLKPQTVDSLINQALAIEDADARDAGALGFMARAMVQATLPHRKVEGNEFVRRNGAFTLSLMAPAKIGLPYGSVPRLLLAWVTTEAVKTQSKDLELGGSMAAFMAELGMTSTGGTNGTITRLKNQTRRLFNSTVSATYQDGDRTADIGYRLADKTVLWWHAKEPEQTGLWQSSITLSDAFFREVVDRPIPVDMRAIKALKQSAMALDIYMTLTYRMSYLKKPTLIQWPSLAFQLGSDYSRVRDFKAAFIQELNKVMLVYSGVRVEVMEEGLHIKPSLTHIPMKGRL